MAKTLLPLILWTSHYGVYGAEVETVVTLTETQSSNLRTYKS